MPIGPGTTTVEEASVICSQRFKILTLSPSSRLYQLGDVRDGLVQACRVKGIALGTMQSLQVSCMLTFRPEQVRPRSFHAPRKATKRRLEEEPVH